MDIELDTLLPAKSTREGLTSDNRPTKSSTRRLSEDSSRRLAALERRLSEQRKLLESSRSVLPDATEPKRHSSAQERNVSKNVLSAHTYC